MKNWQTTVSGIVFAVGTALSASDDQMIKHIGIAVQGVGGLLGFIWAKDRGVTGIGENTRRVD